MRALVVYESLWGNTEQVARAVASALEPEMEVQIVDSESAPLAADSFDLVIVGGPTHAFSMTRQATRQQAATQQGAPHAPSRGIREWLTDLTPTDKAVKAATFDTRVDSPRLPGSAAKAAKRELRQLGFEIVAKQETFRVHGYEGPLIDGELERARNWGRTLAQRLLTA